MGTISHENFFENMLRLMRFGVYLAVANPGGGGGGLGPPLEMLKVY